MRDECCEVYRVNEYGTFISADLGGSSKYSMRSLKTEVEKGSIGIVIIYGLVDPKR